MLINSVAAGVRRIMSATYLVLLMATVTAVLLTMEAWALATGKPSAGPKARLAAELYALDHPEESDSEGEMEVLRY